MASPGDAAALALQSVPACLVGLAAAGRWRYACRNHRPLSDRIHADEALNLQLRFLTEPITALLTVPFAFGGETSRDPAWLSYPLVVRVLQRWRRAMAT